MVYHKRSVIFVIILFFNLSIYSKIYKEGQLRGFDFGENDIEQLAKSATGFSEYSVDKVPLLEETTSEDEKKAHDLMEQIRKENRFVKQFTPSDVMNLPVGIVGSKEDDNYIIMIDDLVVTPQMSYLTVYMSFTLPQNDKKIAFMSKKVPFNFTSGIAGDATLQLVSEIPMNFGSNMRMTIRGTSGTFVKFDCYGFKQLGIHADIEFSGNTLIPESQNEGSQENLKTEIRTTASGWDDIIADVSIPRFYVKGLKDYIFEVKNAVFDFSDLRNPDAIKFPEEYGDSEFLGSNKNTWRGVYVKEVSVELPKCFRKKSAASDQNQNNNNTAKRVKLAGKGMIIDRMGFTGTIEGKNIMTLKEGDMSGWGYSLEQFSVSVAVNKFKEGSLKGRIQVPAFKDGTPLTYSAIISADDKYIFNVGIDKPVELEMLAADLTLNKGSNINVEIVNGKFKPSATLHGQIAISASTKKRSSTDSGTHPTELENNKPKEKNGLILTGRFENMVIKTESPYFEVGTIIFNTGNSMKGFPVQIKEFGIKSKRNKVGLYLHAAVNFTSASDGGFGGEGAFTIWSKRKEGTHKYKYDHLEISKIAIEISKPGAFELKGSIEFFREDPVYGSGFNGEVDADFSGIKVKAKALFGKVKGYRYFYADALAVLPSPIPLVPPIGAKGFGGGVYYRMRQKRIGENVGSSVGASTNSVSGQNADGDEVKLLEVGKSKSGIVYVPDDNISIGFKATVVVSLAAKGTESAFNADLTFEINFTRSGGINQASFLGNGYFMTPMPNIDFNKMKDDAKASVVSSVTGKDPKPQKEGDKPAIPKRETSAALSASVYILYDVPSKTFHAEAQVFINAGPVQGVNSGGMAGRMVMHFDPDEWYIHIGTPTEPVGIKIMNIVKTESYFMLGQRMPAFPDPPQEVKDILGNDLNYSLSGDEEEFGTGKGIAFGARFGISTGDINLPPFYASFSLGAGFDLMVQNYGKGAVCEGRSGPIGINGWFAKGQIYAYVEGRIGIKVNLLFKKGKFDILHIAAAALLQAKGPNPFWMRGIVGGKYNILGGLIKGNCRFSFEIGEHCKIIKENPLGGIDIIASVTPGNGEEDVSVFASPQLVFNMPVGETFEISDEGKKEYYKIVLDKFEITSAGSPVKGTNRWNATNDVVAFESFDVLKPKSELRINAVVSFQQRKSGSWEVLKRNGKKITEARNIAFKTGVAPDEIPVSNIEFSYPMIKQYNFYQDETDYGYIRLKKGQPYLFEDENFIMEARFTQHNSENITKSVVSYDAGNKHLEFGVPDIVNNSLYDLVLVKTPKSSQSDIESNVSDVQTNVDLGIKDDMDVSYDKNIGGETTLVTNTKKTDGGIENYMEKEVVTYPFRSSIYNTFSDKIDNLKFEGTGWTSQVVPRMHEIGKKFSTDEFFDNFEVVGSTKILPIVDYKPRFDLTPWYKDLIYPLMYQNDYGKVSRRRLNIEGLKAPANPETSVYPYVREVSIRQLGNYEVLTDADIKSGSVRHKISLASFMYKCSCYIYDDFYDFQSQLSKAVADGTVAKTDKVRDYLNTQYPSLRKGDYVVDLRYRLPGLNTITSTKQIRFYNSIDFYVN